MMMLNLIISPSDEVVQGVLMGPRENHPCLAREREHAEQPNPYMPSIVAWIAALSLLAILATLLVILLFGPSPGWKDGFLGKAYDFLMNDAWKLFLGSVESVCGTRVASGLDSAATRVFATSHPGLQLFYLGILTTALVLFFIHGYGKLPNPVIGPWQTNYIIPSIIALTYYSFYKCSTVDPGRITQDNLQSALDMYPYDYILYTPKQCQTCQRSKYAFNPLD